MKQWEGQSLFKPTRQAQAQVGKLPQENITVVYVDSERVDRREDGVNSNVEFKAIDEEWIMNEFLYESTWQVQVHVLYLENFNSSVRIALLYEQKVRILRRVLQKLCLLRRNLKGSRNVFEL